MQVCKFSPLYVTGCSCCFVCFLRPCYFLFFYFINLCIFYIYFIILCNYYSLLYYYLFIVHVFLFLCFVIFVLIIIAILPYFFGFIFLCWFIWLFFYLSFFNSFFLFFFVFFFFYLYFWFIPGTNKSMTRVKKGLMKKRSIKLVMKNGEEKHQFVSILRNLRDQEKFRGLSVTDD